MNRELRPEAIETRDIARVKGLVGELFCRLGMLHAVAIGRAPWGFLNRNERRGWGRDVLAACDAVEETLRVTRAAVRSVIEEEAA